MENHIFSKSIIFSGIGSIFRDLSFGTIKTLCKAFWDIFLKICMRTWIRRLRFFIKICPRRVTKTRNLQCMLYEDTVLDSYNKEDYKIKKQIYVLNPFSPFPKAWNQSFDWILSGFSPLPTIECIIWLDIQWIWKTKMKTQKKKKHEIPE